MTSLIDRDALIAEYDRVHVGEAGKARQLMVEAPEVDAVPVIRCKNCKYWIEKVCICGFRDRSRVYDAYDYCEGNDFCSRAERKKE